MKENKIVDLSGNPVKAGDAATRTSKALGESSGSTETTTNTGPVPINAASARPSLTFGEANKLGGAYARLREISQNKILTANDEAEKAGLQTYIRQELDKWGLELLASWFTVHTEYRPILTAIDIVVSRVAGARAGKPVPVETSYATDHSE